MLTLLEVDGFKNLIGFRSAFGPFTCIAGENGVGKSNVFDAIQFLALIADRSLMDAAHEVRSSRKDNAGEPEHLFTIGAGDRRMRFAAEMIVPREVVDDFGTAVSPSITFLRYEVEIGYEAPTAATRHGRLVIGREQLEHINRGDAHRHLTFPHSATKFRNNVVVGERRGGSFISTDLAEERITVHQDGGSRGRPRRALPLRAATTVVSTSIAPTIQRCSRSVAKCNRGAGWLWSRPLFARPIGTSTHKP